MSGRTELPWDAIQSNVITAIDACNEQRPFVSVDKIAAHISKYSDDYPEIVHGVRNMTRTRVIKSRISMSLNKLGWSYFSHHSTTAGNAVFIDPRYRETTKQ